MIFSAEQILAGSSLKHEVEVPAALAASNGGATVEARVVLRALTVRDLQRIGKAAKEDDTVAATLMLQQALLEPALDLEQVGQMPAGLARFLLERVNAISGISTPRDELEELVQAPLAKACFVLAREFGWTAEEVSGMTVGQILLYLEMAHGTGNAT
jgi:ethanolamine ammonia-lyase large subunit